jgi:ABC-type multidrug transport system fused ATPase/permease subunit
LLVVVGKGKETCVADAMIDGQGTQSEDAAERDTPPRGLQPVTQINWRRLFSYVRPYRKRLAIAIGCLFVSSALGLVLPLVSGLLVDAISGQTASGRSTVFTFIGEFYTNVLKRNPPELRYGVLNWVALLLLGVFVLQAIFNFTQSYFLWFVGERVMADLRMQTYEHIQRMSLRFFSDRHVGEITSRVTNDVTTIQKRYHDQYCNLSAKSCHIYWCTCTDVFSQRSPDTADHGGRAWYALGRDLFWTPHSWHFDRGAGFGWRMQRLCSKKQFPAFASSSPLHASRMKSIAFGAQSKMRFGHRCAGPKCVQSFCPLFLFSALLRLCWSYGTVVKRLLLAESVQVIWSRFCCMQA